MSNTPSPLTTLTEDETMFAQAFADFFRDQVGPHVHTMDKNQQLDPGLIKQFFEMGLMGIEIPEEYGGAGGNFFMSILAIEEAAAVDPAVSVFIDVQNTLVINALHKWGNDEQKARYFPRMATDLVGAYALSESSSGSDAFALRCRAERDGDDWILTGNKLWITNANEAGIGEMQSRYCLAVLTGKIPSPSNAEVEEYFSLRSFHSRCGSRSCLH